MLSRKLTIVLGILIIIAGGIAMRTLTAMKKPSERKILEVHLKQVKARKVKNGDLAATIEVTGRLVARHKFELFAEVGGVVEQEDFRFREGNYFKKGQVLIAVEHSEFFMNIKAQKSSFINLATLMLPDLKLDYPDSYPDWKAYVDDLDPEKIIPPLPEPRSDQERYFVSAKNIFNLYYSIAAQEVRVGKHRLIAPFDGVVSQSSINEGGLVRIGQKIGEFLNPYVYELEAAINLQDLPFVIAGQRVRLYSEDVEGNWTGSIKRISSKIDPATQTAKVFIITSGKGLREGMYLSAQIHGNTLHNVVELNRNLMVGEEMLYSIQDSLLRLTPVKSVRYTSTTVAVRGLPDNTVLLDEPLIGAFDGMQVAPHFEIESH